MSIVQQERGDKIMVTQPELKGAVERLTEEIRPKRNLSDVMKGSYPGFYDDIRTILQVLQLQGDQ